MSGQAITGNIDNFITEEQASAILYSNFGQDIAITFRDPRKWDDLLVRADLKNMAINAATGARHSIVKLSDTDRQEATTTTSQLIYCLGPMMMKTIASWDKIDLYIQTWATVAQIQSNLSDDIIQSFLQHKYEKFGQHIEASLDNLYGGDIAWLQEFLELDKTPSVMADVNGIFVRPDITALRDEKRMDSIRIHEQLNSPLAKSYKALMLSPGSYIFPVYTNNPDGSVDKQLVVQAQSIIGG